MKIIQHFLILLILSIVPGNVYGQKVEPFLPEIFGELSNVRDLVISKNKKEIYFTLESYKKELSVIMYIKKKEGNWTDPIVASFSGSYKDLEPFLSDDDLSLYFASKRPLSGTGDPKDFDIWYVFRKDIDSPWSEPVNMGSPINSDKDEYYPSLTRSKNIYFTRETGKETKEDIYYSKFINGKYSNVEVLSGAVNSSTYEFNSFVAYDESYLIYSSYGRKNDMGGSDLYISKRNKNGEWSKAVHMSELNSNKIDYCPFVDKENNILYFTSERSNIKKADGNTLDAKSLMQEINQYSNGLSRIYYIPFDPTSF